MKIFSNFDTNLDDELYKKYVDQHGLENVMVFRRHFIFLIFFVFAPALFYVLWILVFAWMIYLFDIDVADPLFSSILWIFYAAIVLLSLIWLVFALVKRIIDFYMDFALVTPNEILSYNQTGLFSRAWRSIQISKLKTISVDKLWLLKSLFNYGTIKFLSEWDNSGSWDIELYYIFDPDSVKFKMLKVIQFNDSKNNNPDND